MNNIETLPQNQLLAALPGREFESISPHLEMIELALGTVLYEFGDDLRYAYFPLSCIVSKFYVMENGASAELAVIGNDGFVGVALLMDGRNMPNQAVVQSAGYAYRISVKPLMKEINRCGGRRKGLLHNMLLLYTQALITQMSLTAACNRHHSIDQQLCRWLLLSLDRLSSNKLVMTHELIASNLGVRREGITEAAGKLQHAGLIHYSRGQIMILDRRGLEAKVCECYHVVKLEYERLLPVHKAAYPLKAYNQNQDWFVQMKTQLTPLSIEKAGL